MAIEGQGNGLNTGNFQRIQAMAGAQGMLVASFLMTRDAVPFALNEKDIATLLTSSVLPWGRFLASPWPGAPLDGVGRAEQGNRGGSCCSGDMGDACIGSDKQPGRTDQVGCFGQGQLSRPIDGRRWSCNGLGEGDFFGIASASQDNAAVRLFHQTVDQADPMFHRPRFVAEFWVRMNNDEVVFSLNRGLACRGGNNGEILGNVQGFEQAQVMGDGMDIVVIEWQSMGEQGS